jgi:hypothetical protein
VTIILQWQRPNPPLVLAWRGMNGGSNDGLATALAADPVHPIPTLIGPPGVAGPPGPAGPFPDLSALTIDGGVFT